MDHERDPAAHDGILWTSLGIDPPDTCHPGLAGCFIETCDDPNEEIGPLAPEDWDQEFDEGDVPW